jgi:hypothetical protein
MHKKNAFFPVLSIVAGLAALFFMHGCTSEKSVNSSDVSASVYSGTVIDGYHKTPLSNVAITYIDDDGESRVITTNQKGVFHIRDFPAGAINFTFEKNAADSLETAYTSRLMTIGSGGSNLDNPGSIQTSIPLYPLTGRLQGTIKRRFFPGAAEYPAGDVFVKIRYPGKAMIGCFPSTFQAKTDSSGGFSFAGLPLADSMLFEAINTSIMDITYKALPFLQPELISGVLVQMSSITMEPVADRIAYIRTSNVLSYDGVGLNNVPVNATLFFVLSCAIDSASVHVEFEGGGSPKSIITIGGDTIFVKPVFNFAYKEQVTTVINCLDTAGKQIHLVLDGNRRFTTVSNPVFIKTSNMLLDNGAGKTDVPVSVIPYYVFSTPPDPEKISVVFSGGGSPNAVESVNGDTVFAAPVVFFQHNSKVAAEIEGWDLNGNPIKFTLDSEKAFTTEREIFPVASNTWDPQGKQAVNFTPYDTMWVKYSEPLDSSGEAVEWLDPEAAKKIYGKGSMVNAQTWINDDTLFVLPDKRIALLPVDTVGFKPVVSTASGKKSTPRTFSVICAYKDLAVLWTNTRDAQGRMVEDLGILTPVKLVASSAIASVDQIRAIEGQSLPPAIGLNAIGVKKDTIIFTPPLVMAPGILYGLRFDVTLDNGYSMKNVLGVSWKTAYSIKIVSANNIASGRYRMMNVYGDSVTVTFSRPIDTAAAAPQAFTISMADKNGKKYMTSHTWNSTLTAVTIRNIDTLPAADINANPGYVAGADKTRAIVAIRFSLTTADGEQISSLGPQFGEIELHTEPGMAVMDANILDQHFPLEPVLPAAAATSQFPRDTAVSVTFNHPIDTQAIWAAGGQINVIGLVLNNEQVPTTLSFSKDLKTAILTPDKRLTAGNTYNIWINGIAGRGIGGASAISSHAGTFFGKAARKYFLNNGFMIATPDITPLKTHAFIPLNTNEFALGRRIGCSPVEGDGYMHTLGPLNFATSTYLRIMFEEVAWNQDHFDSVTAYQIQVRQISRHGVSTRWLECFYMEAKEFTPAVSCTSVVTISLADLYNFWLLLTPDTDGDASFYTNDQHVFNDSSRIQFRIRPTVGTGDPLKRQVGLWSDTLTFVDNIAPCDKDFVNAANCLVLDRGGVTVSIPSSLKFINTSATIGYLDITFPEDMDISGPTPRVTFYYGTFNGNSSITQPIQPHYPGSGWQTGRVYRCLIGIPPGDYTNGNSGTGAFFNISVAGCKDASGIVVQSYGSDGIMAKTSPTAPDRYNADQITDQTPGSCSLKPGFYICE